MRTPNENGNQDGSGTPITDSAFLPSDINASGLATTPGNSTSSVDHGSTSWALVELPICLQEFLVKIGCDQNEITLFQELNLVTPQDFLAFSANNPETVIQGALPRHMNNTYHTFVMKVYAVGIHI